jgi:hypothetical protein
VGDTWSGAKGGNLDDCRGGGRNAEVKIPRASPRKSIVN